MSIEDTLRTMLRQAIATHPARLARIQPTSSEAERHRADGGTAPTYGASRRSSAPTTNPGPGTGQQHRTGKEVDGVDAVLGRAAAVDEPDLDAAQRAFAAVSTQPATARRRNPCHAMSAPMSMQGRILGTHPDIAQRAGCSQHPIAVHQHGPRLGTVDTFTVQVELASTSTPTPADCTSKAQPSRHSTCTTRRRSTGTSAAWHGTVLSYHALRYADGDQITAMLDLLTRALTPAPAAGQAAPAPDAPPCSIRCPIRGTSRHRPPCGGPPLRGAGDPCRPQPAFPSTSTGQLAGRMSQRPERTLRNDFNDCRRRPSGGDEPGRRAHRRHRAHGPHRSVHPYSRRAGRQPGGPTPDRAATTRDRLRAAIINSGLSWPTQPVVLRTRNRNRSGRRPTPAWTPGLDSGLDTAFAVALLAATGHVPTNTVTSDGLRRRTRPRRGSAA